MMKPLLIEKTRITPEINFDTNGIFSISGICRPEDVPAFFEPLVSWLISFKEYLMSDITRWKKTGILFKFQLKYFNSTSAKQLYRMVQAVKDFQAAGVDIKIEWHYDDDDEQLLEYGQDFSDAAGIDFKFIPD